MIHCVDHRMVDSHLQEVRLHRTVGAPVLSDRMSNKTKRKYYHTSVIAIAIAIPITLCFLGFPLGWREKLVAAP